MSAELDKRYKYSLQIKKPFYLYRKYKRSGIFYVKFHDGKTISTHSTDIQSAYNFALNYLNENPGQNKKIKTQKKNEFQETLRGYYIRGSKWTEYDKIHGSEYSDRVLSQNHFACIKMADLLLDVRDFSSLTKARLHKLQEQLLSSGLTGKSVNNYIAVLHKIYKQLIDKELVKTDVFAGLRNCSHEKKRRLCFPIENFNGYFGSIKTLDRYDLLAYCAIITGARRSELQRLKKEDLELCNDFYILRVRGTKSEYSDRTVPLSVFGAEAVKRMIDEKTASAKNIDRCTSCIGNRIGFSDEQIKADGICFHSFRKMYKTILTGANLNTSLVEVLMGHSTDNQGSNNVERIYFVSQRADMREAYKKVISSLSFLDKKI